MYLFDGEHLRKIEWSATQRNIPNSWILNGKRVKSRMFIFGKGDRQVSRGRWAKVGEKTGTGAESMGSTARVEVGFVGYD